METILLYAVVAIVDVGIGVVAGPAIRAFVASSATDLKALHVKEIAAKDAIITDLGKAKAKAESDLTGVKADFAKLKADTDKVIAELKAKIESFETLIRGAVGDKAAATPAAAATPTPPFVLQTPAQQSGQVEAAPTAIPTIPAATPATENVTVSIAPSAQNE